MSINSIGIIGCGALGNIFRQEIIKSLPQAELSVFDPKVQAYQSSERFDACAAAELVLICVPLTNLADAIAKLSDSNALLLSCCAVMTNQFSGQQNLVNAHPLFGPASYLQNRETFDGLVLAADLLSVGQRAKDIVDDFCQSLGLELKSISAQIHDQTMAEAHFIPYLLKHIIEEGKFSKIRELQTKSTAEFISYLDHCSYSPQILAEIYRYNPYCMASLKKFAESFSNIRSFLDE